MNLEVKKIDIMWGKFKKRFSRSKADEPEPAPPSPNNVNMPKSFRKVPSSYVGFGDDELVATEQVQPNSDSSEACKCAPNLSFHKQLFGSCKNKRHDNSLDSSSVPNIENIVSEDPRTGCVSTFKSMQNELPNNVLSPKSLHQSWIESPKRGCFAQGCMLNSDDCRHSPNLDIQMNGSDPIMCKRFYDDTTTENQIQHNDEFRKVLENCKLSSSSHPVNSEEETRYEIAQISERIQSLNVEDAFDDEKYLDKLNDARRIKADDLMTTSDIISGGKMSPPKMKRREKVRPVSALDPRRDLVQPLDFSNIHGKFLSNRAEISCPSSKNCIPNIADILDDAVYSMDVSESLIMHMKVQDLCQQSVRKSVENATSHTPHEVMYSEPCKRMLDCSNQENTKSEHGSLTKNGNQAYQVAEKDEFNGKESGYTTLEDIQMLIGPAPLANIVAERSVAKECRDRSGLVYASNELPIDYSVKSAQRSDSGYHELDQNILQRRDSQDDVLSLKQHQQGVWSAEKPMSRNEATLLSSECTDNSSRPVENAYFLSEMPSNMFLPISDKHSNVYMEPLASDEVIDLRKCKQVDTNFKRADDFNVAAKTPLLCNSLDSMMTFHQASNSLNSCKQNAHWSNEAYFGQDIQNQASVMNVDNGTEAAVDARRFVAGTKLGQVVGVDDGEYLPPLPSRNYVTYVNTAAAITSAIDAKVQDDASDVRREQTHMTWDEIMQEAKSLGIPLNVPPNDSLGRMSSVSSMASSQVSLGSEDRSSSPVHEAVAESLHGKEMAGSGLPLDMAPRRDGSSADKFRLQTPFFHKSRNGNSCQLASNGVVQNRCLAPAPMAIIVGNVDSFASDPGRNVQLPFVIGKATRLTLSNVHLSESDCGPRSVWGSSVSVPAQCLSSADRSSESMRSLFSNISSGSSPGSSSAVTNSCPETNADLNRSFAQLKDHGWYWGPLGWENAEAMLGDKPDGSFLVRDSSDDHYILSLSFRSQGITHHTRIEHYKGMFSFYQQPKSHGASTIVEFIEKAMEHSRNGKFLYFLRPRAPGHAPAPVQLLYPISRLRSMHSLQHVCRFRILRIVRRDFIDRLPIPPRLKEYLKQAQYYVEGGTSDEHQYFNQDW